VSDQPNGKPDARSEALKHRRLGRYTIPLRAGSKNPGRDDWQLERYEEADIEARFDPAGNLGILLGEPSGNLVDADLDCVEALEVADEFLLPTDYVSGRPSSQRSHRWYTSEVATKQFHDVCKDEKGNGKMLVELRSTGGQTVIPPSFHPNGERLVWHEEGEPAAVDGKLLLKQVSHLAAACLLARHWPGKGSRHAAAVALAGMLIRGGLSQDEAERIIGAAARAAGDEETRDRVRTVASSVKRLENNGKCTGAPSVKEAFGEAVTARLSDWLELKRFKEPRRQPLIMPKPFPVDSLPAPIDRYVTNAAKSIGCDASMVALATLACLAGAVGNTRRIMLKASWIEPCIIWAVIVSESGTQKSPAIEFPSSALFRRQKAAFKEYMKLKAGYDQEVLRYQAELKEWQNSGRKRREDPPEKPVEPVKVRYVVSDVTVEALGPIQSENPRGVLVVRDELNGWFGSFDQYKGGKGSDTAFWLSAFHGRTYVVDRRTNRVTIVVERASVGILGGIQPGILKKSLGREHCEDGIAARLLMCSPPRRAKRWSDAVISAKLQQELDGVFDRLLALDFGANAEGEKVPVDLPLDPDAKSAFVEWADEHGLQQTQFVGDLAAAYSKLEGYCARLALVVHLVRQATGEVATEAIDAKSMEMAIALTEWFKHECRRTYQMLSESDDERAHRELIELIQRHGGTITPRELRQASRRYRDDSDAAEQALNALQKAGLGVWVTDTHDGGPGAPKRYFELRVYGIPSNPEENGVSDTVDRSSDPENEDGDEGVEWIA
jgi:hypothetical protein